MECIVSCGDLELVLESGKLKKGWEGLVWLGNVHGAAFVRH